MREARAAGSSPLTRGKPALQIVGGAINGIIPAHAGKTRNAPKHRRDDRDHPRSRGENNVATCISLGFAGSSPLTRGKPATKDPYSRTA